MLFNSLSFFCFFPIACLAYFILPGKVKNIWLLLCSYFFYMYWNPQYIILLLISTVVTYTSGLLINQYRKYGKIFVAASIISNLSILGVFKYFNFFTGTITEALQRVGILLEVPVIDVLLPVGISFYTFQALGYTIDVYRNDVKAEKNFLNYALFVSFFPQLVAGPIERSKNLLKQVNVTHAFNFERARDGLLLMLWGYFLKIVLADRIAVVVNTVYGNIETYSGFYLIIATILFAFQIYCDFYGYSIIAMGAAKILGFQLMENFEAPYLSQSISEFWRRWHISLSSWFKDYLYIPLGGNRKGKLRKSMNIMIVFMVSGLWHGASLSYIVWGGLNGGYQMVGNVLKPIRNKMVQLLNLHRESFSHKAAKIAGTFVLVDFSWIFFRADGMKEALLVIKNMFAVNNPWILFDGSLYTLGLDNQNWLLLLLGLTILTAADICKYKGICLYKFIVKQDFWFRYLLIIGTSVFIILTGLWGSGYDAAKFIYFQF